METITKIHLAALRKHDKSNDIPRKIFFNENKFFQNLCVVIYMVLICISLMSSNAETPFIYLGDICMLFLDTRLFKHFFFFFLLLSCRRFFYIMGIRPLSNTWFAYVFSCSIGCLFIPFLHSFISCFINCTKVFLVWCHLTCLFLLFLPVFFMSFPGNHCWD